MLHFLLATMVMLVGWLQPAPLPTEAISLDNADRIEQLQQIDYETEEHGDWGSVVAFNPNGATLVFDSSSESLQVWNLQTATAETTIEVPESWLFDGLVFSPDSTALFVSGRNNGVTRWSTSDWTQQPSGQSIYGFSIAVSPDGSILAVASLDGVELYDSTTFAELHTMTYEGTVFDPEFVGLAFSPNGEQIVSISGETVGTDAYIDYPRLMVWDVHTGELLNHAVPSQSPYSVAFSPDGTLIALGDELGDIILWDAPTLTPVATLPAHPEVDVWFYNYVSVLVFSANGDLLIAGDMDGNIRLWDVLTHSEVRTLEGHTNGITDLALSADGTMLASASWDGTVRLWGVR